MSEELEYRCFIGGLSWSTSDRGLKDAFDKYGKLVEAKVVVDKFSGRSRGFGFVTFDDKKAMDEAIEAMNGMELDGRTITVDKAQPHQGGSGRDYDGDRNRDDRYGGGGGGSRYGPDRNGDRSSGGRREGGSRGGSGSDRFSRDRSGPYERRSGGGGVKELLVLLGLDSTPLLEKCSGFFFAGCVLVMIVWGNQCSKSELEMRTWHKCSTVFVPKMLKFAVFVLCNLMLA
ncbi:hypothetical protein F8388_018978 [Cannabis sativa]|uniref:RRM domain-containing protein n=1 Tax=Cannabis sativa TaxID=3483 RepID=A0A7J6H5D5_CANSA|nr:hypothetical protein F8388_018978 [Cannabis sativa]KAF4389928.1 hypothetical protein G4B88_003411 [Cannabis sativa]